jgi:hypothetical protein
MKKQLLAFQIIFQIFFIVIGLAGTALAQQHFTFSGFSIFDTQQQIIEKATGKYDIGTSFSIRPSGVYSLANPQNLDTFIGMQDTKDSNLDKFLN